MTRRLLVMIVDRLVPVGPVVIGMDDTIERRWGRKITARGIYRDPVRSSHGHFVKASGLRWLSFMVLTPVPWAGVVKALPVLTLLAPSERSDYQRGRRHKLLTDWARQGILQLCRWLPGRDIVFVGDSSFAVHELAHAIAGRGTLISRLRLDANLFASPARRNANTIGRPAQKGAPLPKLKTLLSNTATPWGRITVSSWYGRKQSKTLEITSDTALWYRPGTPPRPIRWVLVRDPEGKARLLVTPSQVGGCRRHGRRRHASRRCARVHCQRGYLLGLDVTRNRTKSSLEPDSKVLYCSQCLARRRVRMRIWAMRVHAVELWMDFSQSFASLRDLPSHAKVRSTTQRRGSTLKPF